MDCRTGAAEAARDGLLPDRNADLTMEFASNGCCTGFPNPHFRWLNLRDCRPGAKQVERAAAQLTLNVNDAPQRGHDLALAH